VVETRTGDRFVGTVTNVEEQESRTAFDLATDGVGRSEVPTSGPSVPRASTYGRPERRSHVRNATAKEQARQNLQQLCCGDVVMSCMRRARRGQLTYASDSAECRGGAMGRRSQGGGNTRLRTSPSGGSQFYRSSNRTRLTEQHHSLRPSWGRDRRRRVRILHRRPRGDWDVVDVAPEVIVNSVSDS
jgi:hypothetical protein